MEEDVGADRDGKCSTKLLCYLPSLCHILGELFVEPRDMGVDCRGTKLILSSNGIRLPHSVYSIPRVIRDCRVVACYTNMASGCLLCN